MIVIDASAFLEMLLHTEAAEPVDERLLAHRHEIHAPHLIDAEVAQVVRRYVLHRMIDRGAAAAAIEDLATYPIHRHAHFPLLPRVWDLHANVSACNAQPSTCAAHATILYA